MAGYCIAQATVGVAEFVNGILIIACIAKAAFWQVRLLQRMRTGLQTAVKSLAASANDRTRSSGLQSAASAGGSSTSEFGWYGNMLHDRFYRAWIQPTTNAATSSKISTLVKVRIEKDGRVSKFEIIKPSGNVVVNESVRVVAKQVTQVDPPPTGLIKGDHYDVKINFELNTEEKPNN